MWVAKVSENLGKLFEDYELSPRFKSVIECQEYINTHLKVVEFCLYSAFKEILWSHNWVNGKVEQKFAWFGSFIRCYNLDQKRFADGFDF